MRAPPAFQAHPRHNSRVQISAVLSICASASVREICGSARTSLGKEEVRCSGRKPFDGVQRVRLLDSMDHAKLLARRVTDGVVRRMIDKWLKAGVAIPAPAAAPTNWPVQ